MKFLIDTNILIAVEPTSRDDVEKGTAPAARLIGLLHQVGYQVLLHPDSMVDLAQDRDRGRQAMRNVLMTKYVAVQDPPDVPADWSAEVGVPKYGSNDWVDLRLLASVAARAVHFFVTEDQRLLRRARRLGLTSQVLTVDEAAAIIENLASKTASPSPPAKFRRVHSLDQKDPFFDGLRADYGASFGPWLKKCCDEDRNCWVIQGPRKRIAGLCIIKQESDSPYELAGKVLKICTFKVASEFSGRRFGELLLKYVFHHLSENAFDATYLTVFEQHESLIALLEDFGFRQHGRTKLGELVFAKRLRPDASAGALSPLDYHKLYGPPAILWTTPAFVVPIQPRFHHRLFPDVDLQGAIDAGANASGNAIRKAYLSKGPTKSIPAGSPIMFYVSKPTQAMTVVGVTEETLRSADPQEIATFVGKRTVYSMKDIREKCEDGQCQITAILFRQDRAVRDPVRLKELLKSGTLAAPPQTIARLKKEASTWTRHRLGL